MHHGHMARRFLAELVKRNRRCVGQWFFQTPQYFRQQRQVLRATGYLGVLGLQVARDGGCVSAFVESAATRKGAAKSLHLVTGFLRHKRGHETRIYSPA